MEPYIYLSSLINLLLSITCFYSMKILTMNNLHKGVSLIYLLMQCLSVFLINLDLIYALLIILVFNILFHYLLDKKNFLTNLIIYNFFYYILSFFLSLLNDGLKIYNGVLVLTSKSGLLVSLLIPLFGLLMLFSSLVIDKTFHLHNYQEVIYLTIGTKTMELKGYLDTGNTLLYNNTPVIFITKENNIFNEDEFNIDMNYQTIASGSTTKLAKGLISKKGNKEDYFVYIGTSTNKSYHGCQLLLNAYLF